MTDRLPYLLLALFPLFFVGMWMSVTTLLGVLSGWFTLEQRYPNGDEVAIVELRGCSGSMGAGVAMRRILRLSACRGGLRVGVSRLLGPFQRPFLVPWSEIRVEPGRALFMRLAVLRFGDPQIGTLKIDARDWERLASRVPGVPGLPPNPRKT